MLTTDAQRPLCRRPPGKVVLPVQTFFETWPLVSGHDHLGIHIYGSGICSVCKR
jgi:hypothetical protein